MSGHKGTDPILYEINDRTPFLLHQELHPRTIERSVSEDVVEYVPTSRLEIISPHPVKMSGSPNFPQTLSSISSLR